MGWRACDSGPPLTLMCQDFMTLQPQQAGRFDALYDRASVVALPPDSQARFGVMLGQLMAPGAPGLMLSFEYPPEQREGPPFATDEASCVRSSAQTLSLRCSHGMISERKRWRASTSTGALSASTVCVVRSQRRGDVSTSRLRLDGLDRAAFFASALRMMGWSLVPYAQLDHALNHFQKNRADALILHAPIAGIELSQPLVDRIQRAADTKIVILGSDELRDTRTQRAVPDPVTAAELASSLSALCPTEGKVILHDLLRSETFEGFTQEAVGYL